MFHLFQRERWMAPARNAGKRAVIGREFRLPSTPPGGVIVAREIRDTAPGQRQGVRICRPVGTLELRLQGKVYGAGSFEVLEEFDAIAPGAAWGMLEAVWLNPGTKPWVELGNWLHGADPDFLSEKDGEWLRRHTVTCRSFRLIAVRLDGGRLEVEGQIDGPIVHWKDLQEALAARRFRDALSAQTGGRVSTLGAAIVAGDIPRTGPENTPLGEFFLG